MGRERYSGGRSRGGGSGGGRRTGGNGGGNDGGRDRDRGGRGGGRSASGRGNRGGRRRSRSGGGERGTAHSGNQRERIAVESGHLVFIDQFMLANPQFLQKVRDVVDAEPRDKDEVITDFGGVVISLEPGTYKIERDPFALSIIVHQEGAEIDIESLDRESTNISVTYS